MGTASSQPSQANALTPSQQLFQLMLLQQSQQQQQQQSQDSTAQQQILQLQQQMLQLSQKPVSLLPQQPITLPSLTLTPTTTGTGGGNIFTTSNTSSSTSNSEPVNPKPPRFQQTTRMETSFTIQCDQLSNNLPKLTDKVSKLLLLIATLARMNLIKPELSMLQQALTTMPHTL
ncbi:hypothetical protein Pelo_2117 [Pelomyxa schiedti]|nr:hypothetical protein Pelo_2117 [Pelomyxa schiedti]